MSNAQANTGLTGPETARPLAINKQEHMPPARMRMYHLDALRSFAILYGLLVHTATLGVVWPIGLLSNISGYFRMGAFFLVSGYFTAMVLQRSGAAQFLKKRALALLVPLICGVVLLNPITNWLIWCWHNPRMGFGEYFTRLLQGTLPAGKGPMVWHLHLWFLITLSFYAVTAPAAVSLTRFLPDMLKALPMRLASLPSWLCIALVAAATAASSLVLRTSYELTLHPIMRPEAVWLIRTTLYYWPMFLTGMLVFHYIGFADRFQRVSWPAILIGIAAVLMLQHFMSPDDGRLWEALQLLSRAFLTMALIAALLAIFRRWFSKPSFLSRQAGAVYSIYITHFLVIYLLAWALSPLALPPLLRFVVITTLTAMVTIGLHHGLIKRQPMLSLIFNGTPPSRSRKAC